MDLRWTKKALSDLTRLHDFLAAVDPSAASRTVRNLTARPLRLLDHPRLGARLSGFGAREVRRVLVGPYEVRYEIARDTIYVLRIWHTREHR